jgi:hypothetical protein
MLPIIGEREWGISNSLPWAGRVGKRIALLIIHPRDLIFGLIMG